MDILEASNLESEGKDSINEHESFFLEKPEDPCSHNASLESVTFCATSTYEDNNHLKVLIFKIFKRLVVDAFFYDKFCKPCSCT
ncbi:hypothetical protein BAE44_0019575 [Dichanthelium oligosanthes]|uniref:Uncharacterized protein n=1 Tax=Dichanthelium oligosanthes TaxID=888268 RepID=A0A1E5V2L5_9POAL|nr:hypothetical protein BAE44_0019575 [Dichanthelium oligosanthes]